MNTLTSQDKFPHEFSSGWGVFRIVVVYVVVAGLWILFSDKILAMIVRDSEQITQWSIIKGWLFVAVTAIMLYGLISRHVSRLKAAHKALQSSEEQMRLFFERQLVGMAITSPEKGWCKVNDKLCQMFGYSREELQRMTWAQLTHPDDLAVDLAQFELLLTGKINDYSLEKRFLCKNGEIIFTDLSVGCVRRLDGSLDYVLVLLEDITARKQSEEARTRLEMQLRQSQKLEAMGTLAGGIAHDFNNLLAVIMVNAELARMDLPEHLTVRHNLDDICTAADRAKALVNQILTFSRRSKSERKPLSLPPLITEAVKMLRSTLPSAIEIKVKLNPDSPLVVADMVQIHQVIINLCTNAAQAMKGKPGVIEISLEPFTAADSFRKFHPDLMATQCVRLAVTDSGHGMDEATMKRIFDPFFTTKGPGEGTGLGLAVVHGIVKEHGGSIEVLSHLGQGATFNIYLPTCDVTIVQEEIKPLGLPSGRGQHIMVVDDEPQLLQVAQIILKRLNYQVFTFDNPVVALENFRKNPQTYDLVFTDLSMPKMSGMDLVQQVLALRPGMPIILATGFSGGLSDEQMRAAGITCMVAKPYTPAGLAATMQEVLG